MTQLRPSPLRHEISARPVRTVMRTLVLVAVFAVLWYREPLLDEYAFYTYHAPADVASLESTLDLTRKAQAIFARSRPQIDNKTAFNHDCQTMKGELELGCFVNGHIYVLEIDNDSLKPEMETVLAHELMHAVWAQTSGHEQGQLGSQLEAVYHGLNDDDLKARMEDYATSEPGQETNELHSILGTEETTLTPSLEAYYSKYFTDRASIAAAHAAYEEVFTMRRNELTSQLATVKALKSQLAALDARMQSDKAMGEIVAYNALVPSQNALVDRLNGLITSYNAGVDEYNDLSKSLDSHELGTESGV